MTCSMRGNLDHYGGCKDEAGSVVVLPSLKCVQVHYQKLPMVAAFLFFFSPIYMSLKCCLSGAAQSCVSKWRCSDYADSPTHLSLTGSQGHVHSCGCTLMCRPVSTVIGSPLTNASCLHAATCCTRHKPLFKQYRPLPRVKEASFFSNTLRW